MDIIAILHFERIPPFTTRFLNWYPKTVVMTHAELFVQTIDDIKEKQKKGGEYNMVRACGLLRHLLLDKSPLLILANKKYQLKIRFIVDDDPDTDFSGNWKGIYQKDIDYVFVKSKLVTITEFINLICFQIGNHYYTVSEIINIGSHREGGIHSQIVEDEKEAKIIALDKTLKRKTHLFIKSVNSICNVFINSTLPLYNLIKGLAPTDGFTHYIRLP